MLRSGLDLLKADQLDLCDAIPQRGVRPKWIIVAAMRSVFQKDHLLLKCEQKGGGRTITMKNEPRRSLGHMSPLQQLLCLLSLVWFCSLIIVYGCVVPL